MNPLRYEPRRVQPFAPISAGGSIFKLYGIFSQRNESAVFPPTNVLEELVSTLLPSKQSGDHPLGYAILHFAEDGVYLLLSRWYDANMLKHDVYSCRMEGSTLHASNLADTRIVACIWELEVMKFERDIWIRTILNAGTLDTSAVSAYLNQTFSGWV